MNQEQRNLLEKMKNARRSTELLLSLLTPTLPTSTPSPTPLPLCPCLFCRVRRLSAGVVGRANILCRGARQRLLLKLSIPLLRRHYRAALPLLPSAFRRLRVTAAAADVVLCSTSGWAHGISSDVPKIAYCHNPARWLYQPNDYFHGRPLLRLALSPLMAAGSRRGDIPTCPTRPTCA